eukprot:CAMPEP_0170458422 /NCGR_PEP_ID=MMETSP0123-20130129/5394_1 /TAXON_ID=182087 /ORGANISM="Favella ehrenbergii, Strain Fehren 1" /LENGTH=97 /DNA_ID=CAMNT_0010722559 /DNA_START=470 /DNA_END=763 /DNA_ORIENTATION=+
MEPIVVRCHVEIDNIAFLEGARVGNSVANDLINGSAATAGEVVVVSGRRVGSLPNDILVHNSIDLLGCDAGADGSVARVESLTRDTANFPQLDQVIF